MGLRIAGDNLVQWRFDNVEINYLNLSLTGILKLNFVEIKYGLIFTYMRCVTSRFPPNLRKIATSLYKIIGGVSQAFRRRLADFSQSILFRIWVWDAD